MKMVACGIATPDAPSARNHGTSRHCGRNSDSCGSTDVYIQCHHQFGSTQTVCAGGKSHRLPAQYDSCNAAALGPFGAVAELMGGFIKWAHPDPKCKADSHLDAG